MASSAWEARQGACAIQVAVDDDGRLAATFEWAESKIGPCCLRLMCVDGRDLLAGLRFIDVTTRRVQEEYDLAVGKRVGRHEVVHTECVVRFAGRDGQHIEIVLRAAADGVALRYVLHEAAQITGSDLTLTLPASAPAWPLKYTSWYEEPRFTAAMGSLADGDYGLPLLVQLDPTDSTSYALISESDIDGRYGGSFLRYSAGSLAFTLAAPVNVNDDGVATPWRVFMLGDLGTIVASHLVEDLAAPAAAPVPAWVRPGRAAWSWWSDFYSGAQLDVQLRFVDYAANHGWEYVLVDCGWDAAWMPDLVAAASTRGVGVFLWVSWDWLDIETDLATWASWGVSGIKVDFMESEAQERYRWYDRVIAEAARAGLMVNFHGSVIPRGWARTHPHVMTHEAVRGAEYYAFYSDPLTPEHNTIVPFTRNVIGSADYTPVTFSSPVRVTSDAHELALAIVLESGIMHFADHVDQYLARPLAEAVLDRVSAAWDETRLLGGRPGEWVAMGRRHDDEWLVGVISAGPARTVTFRLPEGFTKRLRVIGDSPDGGLSAAVIQPGDNGDVSLRLRENGGAVILPEAASPCCQHLTGRAPRPINEVVVGEPGGTVSVQVEDCHGLVEVTVPPGWREAEQTADCAWAVTIPDDAPAAGVWIVTLRQTTPGHSPALAHVRVAAPPDFGTTDVVPVRPLKMRNGFGPAERNQSNGGGDPFDGGPLTVAGTTYARGLGVCTPSELHYCLGGVIDRFTALVGVDDETPGTDAIGEVLGDGRLLARFDLQAGRPAHPIDVDVSGVQCVALVASNTGMPAAHIDWLSPTFARRPPPPTAPTERKENK